jgi:flagellar FliL protein
MPLGQMGDIMKKNFLTVIILSLGILNMILTAVIVFAVVPTTMRTNELISKVATTIDLEINGSPDNKSISIEDIENYKLSKDLTINLKKGTDNTSHYALVTASLSLNKTSEDYERLQPLVSTNETKINEYFQNEFSKYTMDQVGEKKEEIKNSVLAELQQYFESEDFIIGVSIEYVTQ